MGSAGGLSVCISFKSYTHKKATSSEMALVLDNYAKHTLAVLVRSRVVKVT